MAKYLYLSFFSLGPIYWLPNISPEIMTLFKGAIFGLICILLMVRWSKSDLRLEGTPFTLFLIAMSALLVSALMHGDVMGDFETLVKYVLPCLIISMLPVMSDSNVDEIMFGIRRAPLVFAVLASLVPLGIIIPEFNWPNPYSEDLDVANLTQSFTGFGGSRTGWSMGASLIAAAALVNCVIGSRKQRLFSVLVLVVIAVALFVPGGRVGMLAFVAMLTTVAGLGLLKRSTVKTSAIWLSMLFITAAIAVSFAEDLRLDTLLSGGLAEGSTGRLEGWAIGWNAFAQSPIFGIGENVAKSLGESFGYGAVHNSILNYLVKFGLFGFMPMLAIFFWIAFKLYRVRRQALENPVILNSMLMTVSVSAAAWTEPVVVFNAYFNIVIFWFAFAAFLKERKSSRGEVLQSHYSAVPPQSMILN